MAVLNLLQSVCFVNGRLGLSAFFMLLATVCWFWLLIRFTRRYRAGLDPQFGFTFGQAFSYLLIMMLTNALIGALIGYGYTYGVVGYEAFIQKSYEATVAVISRVNIPAAMIDQLERNFEVMRSQPAPGFFRTIGGALLSSIIWGGLVALIMAACLKKAPRYEA